LISDIEFWQLLKTFSSQLGTPQILEEKNIQNSKAIINETSQGVDISTNEANISIH
jgi:hypothetical protein